MMVPNHIAKTVQIKSAKATLWFLLGALAFLYFALFIPPFTPTYIAGDSSIYLLNAKRMLEGQLIYKDFFQFTLPGTELFYLAVFKVFGPRIWVPNVTLIVLGLGLTWLILRVSREVIVGMAAYLPSLMFLVFVYWRWLDPSHHWFSTLLMMGAAALVIRKRSTLRLVEAGAACGLAAFFTQTKGASAILGLAVFLLWEHRQKNQTWRTLLRQETYLLTTFVFVLGIVDAYFIGKVGFKTFLYCVIEFVIKYYPAYWPNNFRVYMFGGLALQGHWYTALPKFGMFLFINTLQPLVNVLLYVVYRRRAPTQPEVPWDRLMLLNTLGLALFVGVAPAPAWTRLSAVCPPALIILVWLLTSRPRYHQVLLSLIWAFALMCTLAEPWSRQRQKWICLNLPGGRAAFLSPGYEEYRWICEHTRPSEFVFDGEWPHAYFACDVRNPAGIPFLTFTEYTRPEQVQALVDALEKHQVRLVLWGSISDPFPHPPEGNHLGPFISYLSNHYQLVKLFASGDEAWVRIK
jgi:hypothetical protein